ncbi:hypothetical protein DYB30_006979 [Aphanomyces astaci]|uniref:Enkurin domain-containing protein n=1 Tax=Aphanomyces astaci TaxID=112090 RepID=A0A397CDD1_APHAT|nr:hypothetical protein DYB30_006979 [Aphanomyces astaci]
MATWRGARTNDSSGVASALRPSTGYREDMIRRGAIPRDFVAENRKLVKQKQRELQKKKEEDEERAKAQLERDNFKIKKFTKSRRGGSSSSSSVGDLASEAPSTHSRMSRSSHRSAVDDRLTKARVPTQAELRQREDDLKEMTQHLRNKNVDYISTNAWHVIQQTPKRLDPSPAEVRDSEARRHRNFGEVPGYIRARKAAWAKEEGDRRANLPDPDCPPGMVLMPDDERVATLATLRETLEQTRRQLQALPLRIETLSQIRRKTAIDSKMQEIEDAIVVFDKPKVFMLPPTTLSA